MSKRKAGLEFLFTRFRNFMGIFFHSKRGTLGVAIIVFFVVVAIAAPLITPYSPVAIPSHPQNSPIASRFAKPVWYKYLFPGETLIDNVEVIQDPSFNTAASVEELELSTNSTSGYVSQPQFVPDMGNRGNGCVAIVFERQSTQAPEQVKASLKKVFYYPYTVSPSQFVGFVAVQTEITGNLSVRIDVILEDETGEKTLNWWSQEFHGNETAWASPKPPIDSYAEKLWLKQRFGDAWVIDPSRTMFSEQGNYKYVVEMTFEDTTPGTESKATVYIDDLMLRLLGNSFGFLGTDQYGRDIFTQLLYGTRISLVVGLLAALLSTSIGLIVGLVAGYVGKLVDQVLMRLTDMLLVIPDVPLFIVLMAVLSPSVWNLILLIAMLGWTGFARIVRSQVLSLRERPFVEAAKSLGSGKAHIIIKHILPNVMSFVYVSLATAVPSAIVLEAWLSWLGLYDPSVMTWGRMLHDAENEPLGIRMWWWIVPPGLTIALISLSFVLLGYALDEILNPKLRERR